MRGAQKVRRKRATSEDSQASAEATWGRKFEIPLKMGEEIARSAQGTRWVFYLYTGLETRIGIQRLRQGLRKGKYPSMPCTVLSHWN